MKKLFILLAFVLAIGIILWPVPKDSPTPTVEITAPEIQPSTPQPGDIVTVIANADSEANHFFYWTTDRPIDITHPHQRTVTFCMPSQDVALTAKLDSAADNPK